MKYDLSQVVPVAFLALPDYALHGQVLLEHLHGKLLQVATPGPTMVSSIQRERCENPVTIAQYESHDYKSHHYQSHCYISLCYQSYDYQSLPISITQNDL